MEVPEIEDNIIEISAISRNPGNRAKIIVKSNDRRIDPVGACVGMRGSRIQAIVREMNNEKIDIVNMSDQAEILISRALSPAKPVQLFIDDEKKYCVALFDDDNLDAAIGRGGTNINLASQVTSYKIDAYGVKQYERIQEDHKTMLVDIQDVTPDNAQTLIKAGVETVSDLLDADMEELLTINGLDEESLDLIYEAVQSFIEREIVTDEDSISIDGDLDSDDSLNNDKSEGAELDDISTSPKDLNDDSKDAPNMIDQAPVTNSTTEPDLPDSGEK